MRWNRRSSAFRSFRNRLGNGPRLPTAEAACLEACPAGAVHLPYPGRGPEAFRLPAVGAHRSRRSNKAEAFLPVLHKRRWASPVACCLETRSAACSVAALRRLLRRPPQPPIHKRHQSSPSRRRPNPLQNRSPPPMKVAEVGSTPCLAVATIWSRDLAETLAVLRKSCQQPGKRPMSTRNIIILIIAIIVIAGAAYYMDEEAAEPTTAPATSPAPAAPGTAN